MHFYGLHFYYQVPMNFMVYAGKYGRYLRKTARKPDSNTFPVSFSYFLGSIWDNSENPLVIKLSIKFAYDRSRYQQISLVWL